MRVLFDNAKQAFPGLLIILVMTAGATGQWVPPELVSYPELILHDGKILTVDDRFSMVEAVAIRDGRFLKVGTNQEVLALKGPDTQVIDVQGRSVVPGFIDAHGHGRFVSLSARAGMVDGGRLTCETLETCVEEIRAGAAKARPGQWVSFNGDIRTDVLVLELTRADLDRVVPNNRVVVELNKFMFIMNTPALEPFWSRIEGMPGAYKDPATGESTGRVYGAAAEMLDYDLAEWPEDWDTRLVEQQKHTFRALNSEGITTNIGKVKGLGMSVLNELWRKGELTVRARPALQFVRHNPETEMYLKRVGNLSGFGDDWLRIIGVNLAAVDAGNRTGGQATRLKRRRLLVTPGGRPITWRAHNGEFSGQLQWAMARQDGDWTGEMTEYETILLANRYGWTVTGIHAQGDFGAKVILDAFEEADQERPIKGRYFAFDHGQIRTEEDLRRAARLGVAQAFASKYVFRQNNNIVWQFGEEVHRFSPVKTAIKLGLKPAIELDDVRLEGQQSAALANMQSFITRTDERGRMWGGREAVSREEALRMATIWSAAYSGDEKKLGSIEEGKLGDLVVLGGDYMTVTEDKFGELPIDLTIVGGKIVYDRAKDGLIPRRWRGGVEE